MNPRAWRGLFAALAFLSLFVGFGLRAIRIKRTKAWPRTSATIHSAKMEVTELDDKTDILLPCFAFSYVAAGYNHSRRCSLSTD